MERRPQVYRGLILSAETHCFSSLTSPARFRIYMLFDGELSTENVLVWYMSASQILAALVVQRFLVSVEIVGCYSCVVATICVE